MKMLRNSLLSLVLLSGWTFANTSPSLQLVGEARLSVLFWDVYDSRLYTEDGRYDEGQRPLRLEIRYLMEIKADALVEQTAKEWRHLNFDHPNRDDWLTQLNQLWPDVDKGDTITLELDENNRSLFYLNGMLLGDMQDPDFGEHFVAIWLSPDTSRPRVREALLGSL